MDFIYIIITIAIAQFLSSIWIKSRLEQSIRHEYDKKLAEYHFYLNKREKAADIAKMLAKWIKYRAQEDQLLSRSELIDYYEELTRMSFDLSLWIEDEKLIKEIMSVLNHSSKDATVRDIIIRVRELILKNGTEKFVPNDIVIWPPSNKEKELFKKE